MSEVADEIFRREALAHHARGRVEGGILHFDPRWVTRAVVVVLAATVAALVLSVSITVDEYTSGPAVVRVDGRRVLTTPAPGVVEVIEAQPGDRVEVGDLLVRMVATEEAAELTRATAEYEASLVHYLIDPHETVVKQQLSQVKGRRDSARNALEAKTIRATIAGVVSDVRVKSGQPVVAGEVLCSIVPDGARAISLVALVPADYRPLLAPGLAIRFELDGFRYEYSDVVVDTVSAEAIGPNEVGRVLGTERDGAVHVEPGAKVLVSGKLPASTFHFEGKPYGYFDGLTGTAEVRVRREPLIVTLLPALRKVFP